MAGVKGKSGVYKRTDKNLINLRKVLNIRNTLNNPIKNGELHPNWKGGNSRGYKTGYYSVEYKMWRRAVFTRDNHVCQKCFGERGQYITAHHIKSFAHYPDLRFELSNGKTLCEKCHSETDNYKGRAKIKITSKSHLTEI
jgi:5-methylcytosine-specific restriction endonuclease McrA